MGFNVGKGRGDLRQCGTLLAAPGNHPIQKCEERKDLRRNVSRIAPQVREGLDSQNLLWLTVCQGTPK